MGICTHLAIISVCYLQEKGGMYPLMHLHGSPAPHTMLFNVFVLVALLWARDLLFTHFRGVTRLEVYSYSFWLEKFNFMQPLEACLFGKREASQERSSLTTLSHFLGRLIFHYLLTLVVFGFCEVRIRRLLHFVALHWRKKNTKIESFSNILFQKS